MNIPIEEILISPECLSLLSTMTLPNNKMPPRIKLPKSRTVLKKLSTHSHCEIFTLLKGNYDYAFNGAYYHCTPGTVVLINSEVEHESYYEPETANLEVIWLLVTSEKVRFSSGRIKNDNYEPIDRGSLYSEVSELALKKIWDDCILNPSPFNCQLLKLALACTFARIITHKSGKRLKLREYQESIVDKIKKYIANNITRNMNITELEKLSGYSRYHLQRIFKEFSGYTIMDYKNHCRLEKMKNLLEKNASRKEITYELGFSDTHTFYQWHKKMSKTKRPTDADANIYPVPLSRNS